MRFPIQRAYDNLKKTAEEMLAAQGELAIWRHQLLGQRNPASQNAMGMDPAGKVWKTEDHVVSIQKQGQDQLGRLVFYGQFEPIQGDLIVTLAGNPKTAESALRSVRVGFYRVIDMDVRRQSTGRIIYTKIIAVPDRSQHWQDYSFGGDPLK